MQGVEVFLEHPTQRTPARRDPPPVRLPAGARAEPIAAPRLAEPLMAPRALDDPARSPPPALPEFSGAVS